jgi:ADP-heptose:LPS heptosyltransferase
MMNLLISRHDKIGDFCVTLPVFKIAHEKLENTKIIALVSKVNYAFAQQIPFIDDVILYEDNVFTLAKKIREKNIDVSISCFTDTKLALALLFAGVKERFAPATKIAQIFSNRRVKQRRSEVKMTEAQYNLQLLNAYRTVGYEYQRPLFTFSIEEKQKILQDFKTRCNIKKDSKLVAFHAGFGGSSDGNLTLDDYINLARTASKQENTQVVFTFGPDDIKTKEYIQNHLDFNAILYDSKLSLMDFCKLLASFTLFVSTSTGPMHLAGAVNIPTISFFGTSLFASAKRWASINDIEKQNNYMIKDNYEVSIYQVIENRMKRILSGLL